MPNFSSLGADCHLEIEIEPALLDNTETFQERARNVFASCQQAVDDQLRRQRAISTQTTIAGFEFDYAEPFPSHPCKNGSTDLFGGHSAPVAIHNGCPNDGNRVGPLATVSQARAIRAIARRKKVDLDQILNQRFRITRPDELSIRDASCLIDELNAPSAN